MLYFYIFTFLIIFFIEINSLDNTKLYRPYIFEELQSTHHDSLQKFFQDSSFLTSIYKNYIESNSTIPLSSFSYISKESNPKVLFLVRSYHGHFNSNRLYNIFNFLSSLQNLNYKNWNALIFNTDNTPLPQLIEPFKSDERISIINFELDKFLKQTNTFYTQKQFPDEFNVNRNRFRFNQLYVNNMANFTHKFDEWQAGYEVTDRIFDLLNYFPIDIFDYLVITNGDNYYYPEFLDVFAEKNLNDYTEKNNKIDIYEEDNEINFEEDDETFNIKYKDIIEDQQSEKNGEFDVYVFNYYSRYNQGNFIPDGYSSAMTTTGFNKLYGENSKKNSIYVSNLPFLSHLDTKSFNLMDPLSTSKEKCFSPLLFRGFIDLGGAILKYKRFQLENLRFLKFGDVNCQDGLLFTVLSNYYLDSTYYSKIKHNFSTSKSIENKKAEMLSNEKKFYNEKLVEKYSEDKINILKYFFPNIHNLEDFTYKNLFDSYIYINAEKLPLSLLSTQSSNYLLKRWKVKYINGCYFSHSPNPYSCSKLGGAWFLSPSSRSELSDSCWEKETLDKRITILNKKINDVYKVEYKKYQHFLEKNKEFDKLYKYYKEALVNDTSPSLRKDELKLIRDVESNYYFDLDVLQNTTSLNMIKKINTVNNLTMYSLPPKLHSKSRKKYSHTNSLFYTDFMNKLSEKRGKFCENFGKFLHDSSYLRDLMMVYIPYQKELIPYYFEEKSNQNTINSIKGKVIFIHNDKESVEKFISYNKERNISLHLFSYYKFWKFDSYNFIASNPDIFKFFYNIYNSKLNQVKSKLKSQSNISKHKIEETNRFLSIHSKMSKITAYNKFKSVSLPQINTLSNSTSYDYFKKFMRTQQKFILEYFIEKYCIENRPLGTFTPRSYYYGYFNPFEFIIPIDIYGKRVKSVADLD